MADIKPTCKCGCGKVVKFNLAKNDFNEFVHSHNNRGLRGAQTSQWKGGRIVNSKGYVMIKQYGHPRANSENYVFEHILVLEERLGRHILPHEAPHHMDGNKLNNNISNLMLFPSHSAHHTFHEEMKALIACGRYSWRKCQVCGKYDQPSYLTKRVNSGVKHRRISHLCITSAGV